MSDFDIWIGSKKLDTLDWRGKGAVAGEDTDSVTQATPGTIAMLGFDPFQTDEASDVIDDTDEAKAGDYYLYHATGAYKAEQILKTGKLRLPLVATNKSEEKISNTKKLYYMSFARTLTSGYILDRGEGNGMGDSVILVFDRNKLANIRGATFKPVDYWNNTNAQGRQMGRSKEAEERLFSNSPIANVASALVEVRMFVHNDDYRDKYTKEVLTVCKKQGIKLKLFTKENQKGLFTGNEKAADRKVAFDIVKNYKKPEKWSQDHLRGGTLRKRQPTHYPLSEMQRLVEYAFKKSVDNLSDRAKKDLTTNIFRYSFRTEETTNAFYDYYSGNGALHNMRGGRPEEQDRFNKVMAHMKAKSVMDLCAKLTDKWKILYTEYNERQNAKYEAERLARMAAEDAADPERVRLRAERAKQTAEAEARILANQKSIWGDDSEFEDIDVALAAKTKIDIDNLTLKTTFKMAHPKAKSSNYKFHVMNGDIIVAKLFLDSEDNKNYNIDIMDASHNGIHGKQENSLGAAGLRKILAMVRKEIPTLETIKGFRSTGIRGKAGKKGNTRAFNVKDIAATSFVMPFSELLMDERIVSLAFKDILNGKLSHNSNKPIIVWVGDNGLQIGDGAHRIVEAILAGKKSLRAIKGNQFATEFSGLKRWKPDFKSKTFGLPFSEDQVKKAIAIVKSKTTDTAAAKPKLSKKAQDSLDLVVRCVKDYFPKGAPLNKKIEKGNEFLNKIYDINTKEREAVYAAIPDRVKNDVASIDTTDIALIKPKADYRWYTYGGARALQFPFTRGRSTTQYTLQPGEKFGIRAAASTVGSRVILEKLGENYVFTPSVDKVRLLIKVSKSSQNKVSDKEKSGKVEHTATIKEALAKATTDKKTKSFFNLSKTPQGNAWRLLARWMSLHVGVNVTGEQLFAYEKMRHLLHADKVGSIKDAKPLMKEVVAGAKAFKAILGRLPREKEVSQVLGYIKSLQKGTRKANSIPALTAHDRSWRFSNSRYEKIT